MAINEISNKRKTFPALRCIMGDWIYYVTYMNFSDVSKWVKKTEEIHKNEQLRDMIQREITNRVKDIVSYLIEEKERFFNALVLGVYDGDPEWYPINVKTLPPLDPPDLDEDSSDSIGVLMFQGDEKIFAIDGQHRVVAIKEAFKTDSKLANEQVCSIFIAHKTDEKGMLRTRRLFSTLNRYAVPVSKGDIVALSEDDVFAIVTRKLVEEFSLFKFKVKKPSFIDFSGATNLTSKDKMNLTTILALYDIVATIYIPIRKKTREESDFFKRIKHRRPSDDIIEEIYQQQVSYWETLKNNIPEYAELFNSEPTDEVAEKYRTHENGNILFRPAGQKAFARAVRIMMDRDYSMRKAIQLLSRVPMQVIDEPWIDLLWNPIAKKINGVSITLFENLLLYLVGQEPTKRNYNLLSEYQKALGVEKALPKRVV